MTEALKASAAGQARTGTGATGPAEGNKATQQLALKAGIANQMFHEDIRPREGSSPHGIVGGSNPNGPEGPVFQAMASSVQLAAGVIAGAITKALREAEVLSKILQLPPKPAAGAAASTAATSAAGGGAGLADDAGGLAVRFGNNPNQVSSAFRHIEAAGLSRNAVQSAVQTDLKTAASQIIAGKPFNRTISVGGQNITYTAFKLPDGTINVGRITVP